MGQQLRQTWSACSLVIPESGKLVLNEQVLQSAVAPVTSVVIRTYKKHRGTCMEWNKGGGWSKKPSLGK